MIGMKRDQRNSPIKR